MSNHPRPPAKQCAKQFTCAMCGQTMHGALSEEEALVQYTQEFPNEPLPTNPDGTRTQEAVCCDDCFNSPEMQAIIAAGPPPDWDDDESGH